MQDQLDRLDDITLNLYAKIDLLYHALNSAADKDISTVSLSFLAEDLLEDITKARKVF